MYIEKLDAWTDIGYTEDSLYVPYNHDVQKEPTWSLEKVRPPFPNLIGFLRLPINDTDRTLEIYSNTKYLRIKFSHIEYPVYAWVDGASPISKKVVGISWHIDIWRTYYHKCKYKGWIRKRKFDDFKTHPYQEYPAFYTHSTLDEVMLEGQKRGIYWVILTFIEGKSYYSTFMESISTIIPGATELKTVAPIVVEGLKGIMSSLNTYAKRGYTPPQADGKIGTMLPVIDSFSVIRCLTFPISSNLTEQIYFKSVNGSGSVYGGPTYREVLAGTLAKIFDIEPNNLISAYVSPICPLRIIEDINATGLTEDRPLVISKSVFTKGTFTSEPLVSLDVSDDLLSVDVYANGSFHLDKKEFLDKNTSPRICEILSKYYDWTYKIEDREFSINDKRYRISVDQPHTGAMDVFMPLKNLLDRCYYNWSNFGSLLLQKVEGEPSFGERIFCFEWQEVPQKVEGWKAKYVDGEVTHINIYYDFNVDGHSHGVFRFVGSHAYTLSIEHELVQFFDKDGELIYASELDRLYIVMANKWEWERPGDLYKGVPYLNYYDVGSAFKIGVFRSLQNFVGISAIQSATLTWPVLFGKLPKKYKTDDFHDLLLVDQNGSVLHRFKKNRLYTQYRYQVVTASSNAYVRIIFGGDNEAFDFVSGNEVHVPLTSITVPVQYSNVLKTMNESTQRFLKVYYENQKISADQVLEDERINLDRRKEDTGIMATGIDLIKETMSGLMDVMGGMNNAMSVVGKGIDALVGVVNTTYKGVGKAAKSIPVIGGMFNGWDTENDLITSDMGSQFKESVNYGAKRFANIGLSKAAIRTDEDKNRKDQRDSDAKYRDYLNGIGAFANEPNVSAVSCITDASFINLFGSVRLVYLTKDDYSVKEHKKALKYLGVDVNEYTDYTDIPDGPIKVDPVFVLGKDVPPSAQEYIRRRLEAGVYVDKTL